ncbi:MAG TPA: hypothetical protein VGS27_34860 [Candidatus Sulfotelmatobacter sp.]|nr:hypothetical protein [Candidatus Sulfotelmatobacter sp.]
MGAIGLSDFDGITSPAYDILRPIRDMNARYYDYLFTCGICLTEFRRHSRGIMDMRLRLYFEDFGPLLMPYPPRSEQDEIVQHLDLRTKAMDKLIDKCQASIRLLDELRQSVITAAITGQIDVRNYRAQGVPSCP